MAIHSAGLAKVTIDGTDVTPYLQQVASSWPITAYYRVDGQLERISIDYRAMTPIEREAICDWVRAHHLDPRLVPVSVEIGFDPSTNEWRFPVYIPGPKGGIRYDPETGNVPMRIIRRRRQQWPLAAAEQEGGLARG